MAERITLDLPPSIMEAAREQAVRTHQPVEVVLTIWLDHFVQDQPVASLPDDEIVRLSNLQMDETEQQELSRLLDLNRENALSADQRQRLDELMTTYRRSIVRKAEALKVAVERGLRQPLS
jgi:hypothetical protein